MKDYSQGGEQAVIIDYFSDWKTNPRSFLEIGANDGITFSNAYALASLGGWSGVCVEPSVPAFIKLETAHEGRRDRVSLVNAAITTIDGPVEFYDSGTHLHKGDVALLSTTRPEELVRWEKSGEQFTKAVVRGITFDTLLKECGRSHFDFISIDAEGADWDILKQIDLEKVGCRMLCIEVNQRTGEFDRVASFCKTFGLVPHWRSYENAIFVDRG